MGPEGLHHATRASQHRQHSGLWGEESYPVCGLEHAFFTLDRRDSCFDPGFSHAVLS